MDSVMIDSDTRKIKIPWKQIGNVGSGIAKGFGSMFGGNNYGYGSNPYGMYKRDQNDEGEKYLVTYRNYSL